MSTMIVWQSLRLLGPTIKEEVHLNEKKNQNNNNIIWPLTLTLGSRQHEALSSTLYIMWPMDLQNLKLISQTLLDNMHLKPNSLFYLLTMGSSTRNVAQYPLHHVAYGPAKFEVANGLGQYAFKREYIIWPLTLESRLHETLPSTLYNMWRMHLQKG